MVALTGRTALTKQQLPPEAERALREFARDFAGALDPLRQDLVSAIESGRLDPSRPGRLRAEVESLAGRYTGDIQTVYREGTRQGARAGRAVAGRRHQLDIAFNLVPSHVLEEFDDWADEIVETEVMETITEDTTRFIRSAQEEGLAIDEIAETLNEDLFDGRLQDHVAERNARTATISSSNAGTHSAFEDADGVIAEEWVASLDGRERDAHAAADGQIVPVDGTFRVDDEALRYPGDPQGSAENIIQCRCTVVPRFADQLTTNQRATLEAGGRLNV